ncbi:LOW QUALITY PROTEIN: AP endonuclease, family 2, partial [Streptomyces himastatinicus ATCC 53653]
GARHEARLLDPRRPRYAHVRRRPARRRERVPRCRAARAPRGARAPRDRGGRTRAGGGGVPGRRGGHPDRRRVRAGRGGGPDEPVLSGLRELLALAHDLGAANVRVFPGGGDRDPAEADASAAARLGDAAPYATELGVRLLLETHDSHRTGADAARVIGPVGHGSVGAIWDVMHPWLGGEDPATSYAALSPYLGYVQVKDIASAEDTTPLALGAGVLPLTECVELLSREGWDGWLCWEYEKRWYPQAQELPPLLAPGRDHLLRLLADAA